MLKTTELYIMYSDSFAYRYLPMRITDLVMILVNSSITNHCAVFDFTSTKK